MLKPRSNWNPSRRETVFVVLAILLGLSFCLVVQDLGKPRLGPPITFTAMPQGSVPIAPSAIVSPTIVEATFETVCAVDGWVVLQGFLHLPETASCDQNEESSTCRVYLVDPPSGKSMAVAAPIDEMEGIGYPNQRFIWSSIGAPLGEQDMIEIAGRVSPYETTDDSMIECQIADVAEIQGIPEFTLVDWDFPHITLHEAMRRDLIDVFILGNGLEKINVKVTPKMEFQFELEIEAGTVFEAQTGDVQNMVVRKMGFIRVKPGIDTGLDVDVACADMEKRQPTSSDVFTVAAGSGAEDLLKLLQLEAFTNESFRIQQFAVWTITDNPAPDEYLSLTLAPGVFRGPASDELARIKTLFRQAGIDVTDYQALAP